jgi:hypothetical protein
VADVGEEMSLGSPAKFDNPTLNLMNLLRFTKDGKTIYFTRNNYLEGRKEKTGITVTLVKIYKASLEMTNG